MRSFRFAEASDEQWFGDHAGRMMQSRPRRRKKLTTEDTENHEEAGGCAKGKTLKGSRAAVVSSSGFIGTGGVSPVSESVGSGVPDTGAAGPFAASQAITSSGSPSR